MTKTTKTILWIVGIAVPLGLLIVGFFRVKSIWEKIKIRPYFISADLRGLTLADIPAILLSGQERTITAKLGMEIKNDSTTSIPFCYLKAVLSYKGTVISTTSEQLAASCSKIPANSVLNKEDEVIIKLNRAGAALLTDKLLGRNPEIEYALQLSIFGVPVSKLFPNKLKGTFPW